MTYVQSREPRQSKEKTESIKWFSDLHLCIVSHSRHAPHTHTHGGVGPVLHHREMAQQLRESLLPLKRTSIGFPMPTHNHLQLQLKGIESLLHPSLHRHQNICVHTHRHIKINEDI